MLSGVPKKILLQIYTKKTGPHDLGAGTIENKLLPSGVAKTTQILLQFNSLYS